MNLLAPVSKLMTYNPITLPPFAKIEEAERVFNEYKVHHIPITRDTKLVGILSMSDYLLFKRGFLNNMDEKREEEKRLSNYTIDDIMTKGIATMASDENLNIALEIFSENLFHAIPIVDDENLVGILTTHDIIINLAKDNGAYAEYE